MSITLTTHFTGNLYLPTNAEASQEVLTDNITKYEEQYLKTIFGYAFWKLFDAGVTAETAIYTAIVDGAEYVDIYGLTQKWEGFNTIGKNPIANYVYYFTRQNSASGTNTTGEAVSNYENQTAVSPRQKMVSAWNEMVDFNMKLHGYLYANSDIYPDYIGLQFMPYSQTMPFQTQANQYLFMKINVMF